MLVPLLLDGAGGDLGVQHHHRTTPTYTAMGISEKPSQMSTASTSASAAPERLRRRRAHAQTPAAAPDPVIEVKPHDGHGDEVERSRPQDVRKPVATLW